MSYSYGLNVPSSSNGGTGWPYRAKRRTRGGRKSRSRGRARTRRHRPPHRRRPRTRRRRTGGMCLQPTGATGMKCD